MKRYVSGQRRGRPGTGTKVATTVTSLVAVVLTASIAVAQGPAMGQPGAAPFSNITRRPSVSPYMGLAFQGNNPTTGGTLGAMQGLVRPQQQQIAQRQQAARQSRQLSQLQGQIRKIQRPSGGSTVETIRATGHASSFMELSHFYPSAR